MQEWDYSDLERIVYEGEKSIDQAVREVGRTMRSLTRQRVSRRPSPDDEDEVQIYFDQAVGNLLDAAKALERLF